MTKSQWFAATVGSGLNVKTTLCPLESALDFVKNGGKGLQRAKSDKLPARFQ